MTKKLQHIFALSEKGAKDLVKAVFWCFVCNLAPMFPVGAVLFTLHTKVSLCFSFLLFRALPFCCLYCTTQ